jgi:hypothetical protein
MNKTPYFAPFSCVTYVTANQISTILSYLFKIYDLATSQSISLIWTMHLVMVRWLGCFDKLVSSVGESFILLAGLTKSNWSWAKSQTKNCPSSPFLSIPYLRPVFFSYSISNFSSFYLAGRLGVRIMVSGWGITAAWYSGEIALLTVEI